MESRHQINKSPLWKLKEGKREKEEEGLMWRDSKLVLV